MAHETESGPWPEAHVTSRHGSSTSATIDQSSNKSMPYLVHLATLCGISIAVSLIGFVMLRDRVIDAENETRLLEFYVMQSDAEMVKSGLKNSEDTFKFKQEHK